MDAKSLHRQGAKLDLRRKAPPVPALQPVQLPPAAAANAPPLTPTTLLPRGQPVMSDYTRQQLGKLGWREGDPVPGDLGERIKEITAAYEQERVQAQHVVPEGWKPVKQTIVEIDTLPPEKQAELRQYLATYKQHCDEETIALQQQQAREATVNQDAPPSVQAAQRVAMNAAMSAQQQYEFLDDLPPVPEGKQLGGVSGISSTFRSLEQLKQQVRTKPEPPPKPEPPVEPESAGAMPKVTHCPRCAWDTRIAFNLPVTEDDKFLYRAAILGGARFEKELSLFDGALRMRFRSLTNGELRMIREQLRYDVNAGRIAGEGEFIAELWEYNLICCVSQLCRDQTVIDIPPAAEIEYDPPEPGKPHTPLLALREFFFKEVAPTETAARMIREQFQLFNRLQEQLEVMSQEPNFFRGIAPEL